MTLGNDPTQITIWWLCAWTFSYLQGMRTCSSHLKFLNTVFAPIEALLSSTTLSIFALIRFASFSCRSSWYVRWWNRSGFPLKCAVVSWIIVELVWGYCHMNLERSQKVFCSILKKLYHDWSWGTVDWKWKTLGFQAQREALAVCRAFPTQWIFVHNFIMLDDWWRQLGKCASHDWLQKHDT